MRTNENLGLDLFLSFRHGDGVGWDGGIEWGQYRLLTVLYRVLMLHITGVHNHSILATYYPMPIPTPLTNQQARTMNASHKTTMPVQARAQSLLFQPISIHPSIHPYYIQGKFNGYVGSDHSTKPSEAGIYENHTVPFYHHCSSLYILRRYININVYK